MQLPMDQAPLPPKCAGLEGINAVERRLTEFRMMLSSLQLHQKYILLCIQYIRTGNVENRLFAK